MFVMYIVADFCWLYFEPEALPSLHNVIYFHHIVTFLLLLFPLTHREFSSFTCLDGTMLSPSQLYGVASICTQYSTDNPCCFNRSHGAEHLFHDRAEMLEISEGPHAPVLLAELRPPQVFPATVTPTY